MEGERGEGERPVETNIARAGQGMSEYRAPEGYHRAEESGSNTATVNGGHKHSDKPGEPDGRNGVQRTAERECGGDVAPVVFYLLKTSSELGRR